jgi:hypothetical protein
MKVKSRLSAVTHPPPEAHEAMTVSGLTITSDEPQSVQMRDIQTHRSRSAACKGRCHLLATLVEIFTRCWAPVARRVPKKHFALILNTSFRRARGCHTEF